MRHFAYALLLCLCGPSWSQDNSHISTGIVENMEVGNDGDTVFSTVEYAYYENVEDPAEEAVNSKIHGYHQMWMVDSSRVSTPLSRTFFEKLLDDFIALSKMEADQYNQPWQLDMATHIVPFPHCIQLSISGWEYAGGVHGNGSHLSWIYSREDGQILGLDDLFSDVEAITAIFEKHFRVLMELSPDASLNDSEFWFEDDRFKLNENFFVSGNEFVVYFNTYEISSYAMGPIEIVVPLEELKDYLIFEF